MQTNNDNLLIERGVITSVSTDFIEVLCQSKLDCKRCEDGKGCGGGILARWLGNRQHQIKIPYSTNQLVPQVNQVAEFSLPAQLIVKIALITYGLPLLIVALFFLISSSFLLSEGQDIFFGIVTFGCGFYLSRSIVTSLMSRGVLVPSLLSVREAIAEVHCSLENLSFRTNKY